MAKSKADEDLVPVSVVIDAQISEAAWRKLCAAQGIDLTHENIAAHVNNSIKQTAQKSIDDMGVRWKGKS